MSVGYLTALKNARLDAITTALGNGGKMKLLKSDGSVLATLTLSSPAAPAAANGVLTFSAIAATTASAAGTAVSMKLTTSADVDVETGFTVGQTGDGTNAHLNFNSNVFSVGQNVSVSAWAINHP